MKIILSIIVAIIFIALAMFIPAGSSPDVGDGNNISVVDGKQVISINAKGGFSPRVTNAKADIPTEIRMRTQGTFDCSSTLSIPSLDYFENLPSSGETIINIPPQKVGTKLDGLCAMGMYNFEIKFD